MIRKALISLMVLTAAVVAVLGGVSYVRPLPSDSVIIERAVDSPRVQIGFIHGVCHFVVCTRRNLAGVSGAALYSTSVRRTGPTYLYLKQLDYGRVHASGFGAPFWLISSLLLVWPSMAWYRGPLRRHRRRRRGECVHCGYSLTGLTTGQCPECGQPVPDLSASLPVRGMQTRPAPSLNPGQVSDSPNH